MAHVIGYDCGTLWREALSAQNEGGAIRFGGCPREATGWEPSVPNELRNTLGSANKGLNGLHADDQTADRKSAASYKKSEARGDELQQSPQKRGVARAYNHEREEAELGPS